MASGNTPWPPPSEFNRMLQNPKLAFKLPELQQCTIDTDSNGQPTVRSGAFAAVYKGTYQNGENVCLRVFTSRADDRRERYAAISDYVRQKKLPNLVDFAYHETGIRHSSGKWYPLVTMQWVEGNVLFDWLRDRCLKNDVQSLRNISEQWVELINTLTQARIAHGDLQHNNVMVTKAGELKLVDYDGMCVPAIEGRVNLELGVEPYQHPERNFQTKLFPGIDNFSALFMLVGLRALTVQPQLWTKFIEPPGGDLYDKLLFRKSDFEAPQQSALIHELAHSPDSKVAALVNELVRLRRVPLQSVPPLSQFANDHEAIRKLLLQHDWDAAVTLLDKNTQTSLPADLATAASNACERVQCFAELAAAVNSGDEQAMQRLFKSELLKNYPKAQSLLDVAKGASEVLPVLKKLEELYQAQDWREFVATWDRHSPLVQKRRSTERFRAEVKIARERNSACDSILQMLENPVVEAVALESAWRKLCDLGGHIELSRRADEIGRIVARRRSFEALRNLPDSLKETIDQKFVKEWNEDEFQGLPGADDLRRRYHEAQVRLAALEELRDIVHKAAGNSTVSIERQIYEAAAKLPTGYAIQKELSERVNATVGRLKAHDACQKILAAGDASEEELATAWQNIKSTHGEALLNGMQRQRFELAAKRAPVLQKLFKISLTNIPNLAHDQEVLKTWNVELLNDCKAAAPWRAAYDLAVERRSKLAELRKIIDTEDDFAVSACIEANCFQKYEFSPDIKQRLVEAKQIVEEINKLVDSLKSGQKKEFVERFDQAVVCEFANRFGPHQEQLAEWVKTEILPSKKMGLKEPKLQKQIMPSPSRPGNFQFRWTWPPRRFSSDCLLAFCRERPTMRSSPEDVATYRINIPRVQWESGGAYYDIKPLPIWGSYVAVWAAVDLGFETLFSEPLILGRLDF